MPAQELRCGQQSGADNSDAGMESRSLQVVDLSEETRSGIIRSVTSGRVYHLFGVSRRSRIRRIPMLQVALYEPEIPPNTGNIMRLCAATEARLHLIGRLGFHLDDRSLRRAGLDFLDAVDYQRHVTLADFERVIAGSRLFCFS